MGPMRLMRALAPRMAERGWGRIVNVSSSSGKRPSLTNAAYSVTKAAVLSLSRVVRRRSTPAPACWSTRSRPARSRGRCGSPRAGSPTRPRPRRASRREEALAAQRDKIPLGRMPRPGEMADVIAFLCSERASTVTGAAWSADGGSVPVIL